LSEVVFEFETGRTVPLSELVRHIQHKDSGTVPNLPISGIALDSRHVFQGNLFVALSGISTDGHRFIPDAIQRGAFAVVGSRKMSGLGVPYIQVEDSRLALAYLSAAFYNFPARQLLMIGVTGTDGKTTTVNLIYNILRAAGLNAGMISTVNAVIGSQTLDTGFHVTTPEAPDVQRYLAQMVNTRPKPLTHAVIEATSHGLAQQRVAACDFDIGVVTNITHEHLDFHGSYQDYRAAKARLFTSLSDTFAKRFNPPRCAVLNRDDISYDYLVERTKVHQVSYGMSPDADVRAENIRLAANGLFFEAVGSRNDGREFRIPITSKLVGDYNISNCLAAFTASYSILGLDVDAIREGIASLTGIPGRMERFELGQDFSAFVDFAHTPNALRQALLAARQFAGQGRIIAVFGSAGLRDREKRRLMAETSAELADLTILTAEDPRTESLEDILEEMARGAQARGAQEGETFWRIPDRSSAIRFAIHLARPGDVVLVCGKGHEQSMCFGETEYPWDDRVAMRAALAELLNIPGPVMPYLPTQS
jgi:UDP-N-acetylmuramoyl-L-alanyl-D-glutamate--2,6-diaminopimelate ligase